MSFNPSRFQFTLQTLFWVTTYIAASFGLWVWIHKVIDMHALKIGLQLGLTGYIFCLPFLIGYICLVIPRWKHFAVCCLEIGIYCQLTMAMRDLIYSLQCVSNNCAFPYRIRLVQTTEMFLVTWVYLLWTLWFLALPQLFLEWQTFWRNSLWIKLGMCVVLIDMALYTAFFFHIMIGQYIELQRF